MIYILFLLFKIEATFRNTGQFPLITVIEQNSTDRSTQITNNGANSNAQSIVNISGGPAFPYTYQLHQTILHFGHAFTLQSQTQPFVEELHQRYGSEHTIDQIRFPAEVCYYFV